MALTWHTSPGREVGGLGRGRRKARLLPSPAGAGQGHGDTAAPRDMPWHRHLRSHRLSPALWARAVPPIPVSPLSCCDAFFPFPELFHSILLQSPTFFPYLFPDRTPGILSVLKFHGPLGYGKDVPIGWVHRSGLPKEWRVNYERARSQAAASSTDGITRDGAGEEAQGMQLSRRRRDPHLRSLPLCGCLSRGTSAAETRGFGCCTQRDCSPRYGVCGPRGQPLNPPLPLAPLSALLN